MLQLFVIITVDDSEAIGLSLHFMAAWIHDVCLLSVCYSVCVNHTKQWQRLRSLQQSHGTVPPHMYRQYRNDKKRKGTKPATLQKSSLEGPFLSICTRPNVSIHLMAFFTRGNSAPWRCRNMKPTTLLEKPTIGTLRQYIHTKDFAFHQRIKTNQNGCVKQMGLQLYMHFYKTMICFRSLLP